eukprot:651754-Pelagomonas_calceolata.AAC.4
MEVLVMQGKQADGSLELTFGNAAGKHTVAEALMVGNEELSECSAHGAESWCAGECTLELKEAAQEDQLPEIKLHIYKADM